MSSKKTTVILDESLLLDLSLIASAFDKSRNTVIADALAEYVERNIPRAEAIIVKQAELDKLKEGV